jgi:hypothetical protein
MQYPCRIRKTYLGEFEITFPDFPSFAQYFSNEQKALNALDNALVDAMAKAIASNKRVPLPSRKTAEEFLVGIDDQTMTQIQLYNQSIVQ